MDVPDEATIRIGFAPTDQRFPHFAVGAADQRVLSVLSTPAIDHGSVVGSLNLYSHREEPFEQRDRDTAAITPRRSPLGPPSSDGFDDLGRLR